MHKMRFNVEATYVAEVDVEMTDEEYKAYTETSEDGMGFLIDSDGECVLDTWDIPLEKLGEMIAKGEIYPDSSSLYLIKEEV